MAREDTKLMSAGCGIVSISSPVLKPDPALLSDCDREHVGLQYITAVGLTVPGAVGCKGQGAV